VERQIETNALTHHKMHEAFAKKAEIKEALSRAQLQRRLQTSRPRGRAGARAPKSRGCEDRSRQVWED
jgi:hypothetical protein